MNVLIIGSGGREHTLAWKIKQSALCQKLYVAPGNGGTGSIAENVKIDPSDFNLVEQFVEERQIGMIVVGPEEFLVKGIADYFKNHKDLVVIGPSAAGAALEGSKAFAKSFMKEMGIPTAAYRSFEQMELEDALAFIAEQNPPYVIKADGLAAGKGVVICQESEEAMQCVKDMLGGQFGEASCRVVIESFLNGIEFSVFVLTDGKSWKLLPVAKDYKKVGEGDTGLNTGGMGAVSPVPFVDHLLMTKVIDRIIKPTISGLQKREIDYKGIIFFGLINVGGDPFVIEYNCRLGDPETEVILPRVESDLLQAFIALGNGKLNEIEIKEKDEAVCTVMYCAKGYPGAYHKGHSIVLPETTDQTLIFHAGTLVNDRGELKSSGGRVLAVSSFAKTRQEALAKSYFVLSKIDFEGGFYRKDIGFDLG
jgi:phosphoribosylamine--glycine ligase